MFGLYRTLLAGLVVLQHLAGVNLIGVYAVFGFYVLSGYLMTMIMQQGYGYQLRGFGRFALNRLLRLFPAYWVACAVTLAILWYLGGDTGRQFDRVLYVPDDAAGWLRNLFLFFPGLEHPRLSPPAWALTVEIFFYICIGLGASRSLRWTLLMLALGAGYHVHALWLDLSWEFRYFTIIAGALPFSVGALIYHCKAPTREFRERLPAATPAILTMALLGNWLLAQRSGNLVQLPFYLNIVIAALCVWCLSDWHRRVASRWRRLDKLCGDYSYPIYLLHYQLGLLVYATLGLEARGGLLFVATTPALLALSYMMVRWIESPMEVIRGRVRPGNTGRHTGP